MDAYECTQNYYVVFKGSVCVCVLFSHYVYLTWKTDGIVNWNILYTLA